MQNVLGRWQRCWGTECCQWQKDCEMKDMDDSSERERILKIWLLHLGNEGGGEECEQN